MIERPDAVNWSTLKAMRDSPKHYRYGLEHPREDTEALLLGRLTHAMIYEPQAVEVRYVREPNFHRGMNDDSARAKGYDGGKQAAAAWADTRQAVPADLWMRATDMAAALNSDPIAGPLVRGGYAEQLVTWTDSATGIECRGRVDHVNGCLSDLKTTRSIAPRLFASQAATLGYHAQLAYYADGLAANGIVLVEPPALVVVENVAPYDVAVLELDDDTLAAGRRVYRRCLDRLAECRAADSWPGVSSGERSRLVLPTWAADQPDETLTLAGEPITF